VVSAYQKAGRWNYGRKSMGSYVFDTFNGIFMIFMMVITLYPFIYVLFASFSEPVRFFSHSGLLLRPLGFQVEGYKLVFQYKAIQNGYLVTLFVVIAGSACNMAATLIFAYVLSRKNIMLHGLFTFFAVFTMYFSGGMIPTFIVVRNLGLIDSLWALILPGLISTFNVIIVRTAFSSIPQEMEESAKMDGAGTMRTLVFILIPLIIPTIAAITLFYMVGHWNSWTGALIYIRNPAKSPLQLVLRSILMQGEVNQAAAAGSSAVLGYESSINAYIRNLIKYCVVIVSIVPIICVYPFIQRYFTKGVMIGAIKG
jgi:putative aldouronate transport system permease protein